jgi:hypothetical protein
MQSKVKQHTGKYGGAELLLPNALNCRRVKTSLDAKSTLFGTKEMLSSMLQTSFEFLQHAEAGAEGRLPSVLKKLGGASL